MSEEKKVYNNSIDIVEDLLITPMKEMLKADKSTWGSFEDRVKKINALYDECQRIMGEHSFNNMHINIKIKLAHFYKLVREYMDTDTLEIGDYNRYNADNILTKGSLDIIYGEYQKSKIPIVGYDNYYSREYSEIGKCRDCGKPILLNYGQVCKFKELIESKKKKGKQFNWPTRCLRCANIKRLRKASRNPNYNDEYREELKFRLLYEEYKRSKRKRIYS